MADRIFFDESRYFAWADASAVNGGKWGAVVFFKRKPVKDPSVDPGETHWIAATFDSHSEAMESAVLLIRDLGNG